MKTKNDVVNFLHNLEVDVFTTMEDNENLIRVKEILTNFFQDENSERLESVI